MAVIIAVGGTVIVLTVLGLDTLGPVQRLAYYSLLACVCTPICYAQNAVTLYFMRSRSPFWGGLGLTIATLVAAVPCTAVAYVVQTRFYRAQPGLPALYLKTATAATSCALLVYYVVCRRVKHAAAAAAVAAAAPGKNDAREVVDGHGTPSHSERVTAASDERRKRFFDRLAGKVGGELVYVRTDDHYIKVYTTASSVHLRMRFADAVIDLGELGMQVHRSYWVAHRHVIGPVKRDHRTLLRLTGDHEVPVSRSYVESVRASLRTRSGYRDSSLHSADGAE